MNWWKFGDSHELSISSEIWKIETLIILIFGHCVIEATGVWQCLKRCIEKWFFDHRGCRPTSWTLSLSEAARFRYTVDSQKTERSKTRILRNTQRLIKLKIVLFFLFLLQTELSKYRIPNLRARTWKYVIAGRRWFVREATVVMTRC